MHGRKKPPAGYEPSEEVKAAAAKKLVKYTALVSRAKQHRADGLMTEEALHLNGLCMMANADIYHLWNYRRQVLLKLVEADSTKIPDFVAGELRLTQEALANRNPKSYCVWSHRQWLVEKFDVPLEAELKLCSKFLEYDERNFHCWNYRQWVTERAGIPAQDEFDFTTEKIHRNFSNYSAWHYRSKLLLKLAADKGAISLATLVPELELVRQAVFTEPDDQSPWLYQRWLFGQVHRIVRDGSADAVAALKQLQAELECCQELLEAEEGSKWPTLATAVLSKIVGCEAKVSSLSGRAAELYKQLETIDPVHAKFYQYAAKHDRAALTFGM